MKRTESPKSISQYVPAMGTGSRYLFAGDEIIARLGDALAAGEGLNTLLPDENERTYINNSFSGNAAVHGMAILHRNRRASYAHIMQ